MDVFRVIATSLGARARVLIGRLRGIGSLGNPSGSEGIDDAEVIHPLGFVSRPKFAGGTDETHDAIGYRDGDEVVVLAIRKKSAGLLSASPTLQEGETRLFAAGDVACILRLLPDGNIEVQPRAGQSVTVRASAGGQIRLDAGSYAGLDVGRVNDPCAKNTALGLWMTQVETAINLLAAGAVTPLSTTFTNVATIASGAPNVKG